MFACTLEENYVSINWTDNPLPFLNLQEISVVPASLSKIFFMNRESWIYFFFGIIGCCISGIIMPLFTLVYAQIFNVSKYFSKAFIFNFENSEAFCFFYQK